MGILTKWRVKQAYKFGRLEHKFDKLLGLLLIATTIYALFIGIPTILTLLIASCMLTYLLYLSCHTLEKKFFGRYGPRG